jgi:hypothetical protein
LLFSLLLVLLAGEVVFAFGTKTPIKQYHVLGLAVYGVFFTTGVLALADFLRSRFASKTPFKLFLSVVVAGLVICFLIQAYPRYGNSDRYPDNYLKAYEQVGEFVQNNMSEDAVFLASPIAFSQYCRRTAIWPDGINSRPELYQLLTTDDINYALHWLKYCKADYIYIEERQIGMKLSDGWPTDGLTRLLQDKSHFQECYSLWVEGGDRNSTNKWAKAGRIVIYEVNY